VFGYSEIDIRQEAEKCVRYNEYVSASCTLNFEGGGFGHASSLSGMS
jgi:hypothetical protein